MILIGALLCFLSLVFIVVSAVMVITKALGKNSWENKKIAILSGSSFGVFILSIIIMFSSSAPVDKTNQIPVPVSQNTTANEPNDTLPVLGDTLTSFKKAYGEPKGSTLYSFKNGKLLVMFVDDRAFNITVNHSYVSLKQAEEEASQYMPKDKTEINRYISQEPDIEKTIIVYNSPYLSNINEAKQYAELTDVPAGDFIVIYNANANRQVYASIVGIGNKP